MHPPISGQSTLKKRLGAVTAVLAALTLGGLGVAPATAAPDSSPKLPVSDSVKAGADIGFHDVTRDGSEREIRNDLEGELSGMVELAQASTVNPTDNAAAELPVTVADRDALLIFTPSSEVQSLDVEVSVGGKPLGTLALNGPKNLPASDQNYSRGSVAYSLRAWSVELPAEWVKPGLALSFTNQDGAGGTISAIDVAAPTELVINNIRLGMITDAPVSDSQRFITDPANGASDYFQTVPISKLTVAQYETVELDKVIVGNGDIYTPESPDPSVGSVYAGKMREDVGKAQVSTGINLATFGITSSAMSQKQPGTTNQRVIHHSAGLYSTGRHKHGLSGGNGMATLYDSVGNELSHELGHSYGIGHFPGRDANATGDDVIRNASHHADSGWGYNAYRHLMRANLDTGDLKEAKNLNGDLFTETLAGKYNYNTDAMAGGWDASPVSDYTLHTGYTLKRIQQNLTTLVADVSYPSGYRDWDAKAGSWVDAKELDPDLDLPKPVTVGGSVFTILGGYNPANTAQTLVYPAFRSNYGVTFDLPQADTASVSADRACWLEVAYDGKATEHIELDAGDGVKQLNVNLAEDSNPTSAQVSCRQNGTTTALGNKIAISTDLEPMADAVVVGQEAGYETLRAQELSALEPTLEALADVPAPMGSSDMTVLRGWSDDLSLLGADARRVADRVLELADDARDVESYLAENAGKIAGGSKATLATLTDFLTEKGYHEETGELLPDGSSVTVDNGKCLYLESAEDGKISALVDADAAKCSTTREDAFYVDAAGRIHSVQNPDRCLAAATPLIIAACATGSAEQRWVIGDAGVVTKASNERSAMDYNRSLGTVGLYGISGTGNQTWTAFAASSNPLLAVLGGKGLAALTAALDPANMQQPDPDEQAPGTTDPGTEVPVPGTPEPGAGTPEPGAESPGTEPGTEPVPGTPEPEAESPEPGTETGNDTAQKPGTDQVIANPDGHDPDGTNPHGNNNASAGAGSAPEENGTAEAEAVKAADATGDSPLATTGANLLGAPLFAGLALLLAGGWILYLRRGRRA